MTGLRKKFGVVVGLCYLLSLTVPISAACPCHGDIRCGKWIDPPAENLGCFGSEASASCCSASQPECGDPAADDGRMPGCCSCDGQCYCCTLLQPADKYPAAHNRTPVEPESKPAFVNFGFIHVSAVPVVSEAAAHTLDRINLAPHIPSTVLLC